MRRASLALPIGLVWLSTLAAAPISSDPSEDPKAIATLRKMGVTLIHDQGDSTRPVVAGMITTLVRETDEAIALLKKLPQLRELTMASVSLADGDLEHLKALKHLHTLHITFAVITDKDLEAIKDLKELRSLDLSNSELSTRAIERLKDLTGLRELKLSGFRTVTDATAAGLASLDKLERLELQYGPNLSDEGLARLRGLKGLKYLLLNSNKITDGGLAVLKDLENLESLNLFTQTTSAAGLEHLKGVKKLKELSLTGYRIPDAGLAPLKELTQLEDLTLSCQYVGDGGLECLKSLTNLRRLTLMTRMTNNGLSHLKGLDKLRELRIYPGAVTADALAELRQSMPKVRLKR
jgi:Leucine-rich repeat (LRR) protein